MAIKTTSVIQPLSGNQKFWSTLRLSQCWNIIWMTDEHGENCYFNVERVTGIVRKNSTVWNDPTLP